MKFAVGNKNVGSVRFVKEQGSEVKHRKSKLAYFHENLSLIKTLVFFLEVLQ